MTITPCLAARLDRARDEEEGAMYTRVMRMAILEVGDGTPLAGIFVFHRRVRLAAGETKRITLEDVPDGMVFLTPLPPDVSVQVRRRRGQITLEVSNQGAQRQVQVEGLVIQEA